MSLRLRQCQDSGLGGTKRVTQFLYVGQPDTVESRPQLRICHRLLSQEELDVGKVLRVGAPHHLGEDEERIIHDG